MARANAQARVDLPSPVTTLIGRDVELATCRERLVDPGVRLLTLTGPPGTAKTRLAMALAEALHDTFPAGVNFVPLTALSRPEQVMTSIAQQLGVRQLGRRPPLERLVRALRARQVLLVLDNFEHLLSAAPAVIELIASCPKLKVHTTSRWRLNVSGEHQIPVPPLEVPALMPLPALSALAKVPAVRLFVERAQAVRPAFKVDKDAPRSMAKRWRTRPGHHQHDGQQPGERHGQGEDSRLNAG